MKKEGNGDDDFEFCPVLAHLVRSRKVVGKNGKVFEQLAALSSRNNLLTLRHMMLRLNPERTLEIGLGLGGSALMFATTHRDLNHSPCAQHTAVDPFQKTLWDSCGLMALEHAGLEQYVDFRQVLSSLELPRMIEAGERFDLVYVDGSHLFEDMFVDAYFVMRLLQPGGIVAFDDSTNPHVAKVIGFIRNCLVSGLEEFDLSKYRPASSAGIIYRVGRWLGKTQLSAFQKIGSCEREWNAPFCPF
jgi:predicted O-methyltransferase YrrM